MKEKNTFFVGYLPLPGRHRAFLKFILPLIFICLGVLGFIFSSYQVSPSKGKGWDPTGKTAITIRARLITKPYVLANFFYKSKNYTAILTSMTKSGVKNRVKGLHNKWVNLKGILTQYNGRFVFSVLDSPGSISLLKDQGVSSKIWNKKNLGVRVLRGEVIDPKCYVGAMKPGMGKTHKACATLCIKGGIPPALLVRDQLFGEKFYLLLNEKSEPVLNSILPFVGDQVEVQGTVERWNDLLFFKIKAKHIKRLHL